MKKTSVSESNENNFKKQWQFKNLTPEQDARLAMLLLAEMYQNAQKSFPIFTQLVNQKYKMTWFHEILFNELTDWINGVNPYLIIAMPPRHGKSEICSRLLPAFLFGLNPDEKIALASYSPELSGSFNRDIQTIMAETKYRCIFNSKPCAPNRASPSVNNASQFHIEKAKGYLLSVGVGTALTGFGANRLIVDDAFKNYEDSRSPTQRDKVWNWFNTVAMTRLESIDDQKKGALVVGTRWHEDDLTGRLLASKELPWRYVCFPAEAFDRNDEDRHPLDKRKHGEALWPERMDKQSIRALSKQMGEAVASGPLQQKPNSGKGIIFKREDFNFYKKLPDIFSQKIICVDLAMKEKQTNDFNAALCVGFKAASDEYGTPLKDTLNQLIYEAYVLDYMQIKCEFSDTLVELKKFFDRNKDARFKYIEDKANGMAAISMLKQNYKDIKPWSFPSDKIARANAISYFVASKKVYFPDKSIAPWADVVLDEICGFPNKKHDDLFDCFAMSILIIQDEAKKFSRFQGW